MHIHTHTHTGVQSDSRIVNATVGDVFLRLCDQRTSHKHASDFEPLQSQDRLKPSIRITENVGNKIMNRQTDTSCDKFNV